MALSFTRDTLPVVAITTRTVKLPRALGMSATMSTFTKYPNKKY